ncbi:hypothetical protein SKAU_G00096510 [Synaphobranchus kaupii]|uniref:Reverse transcriptase domain-containing protein n=1 Tax=Synaphobranchus kaupii TaxID=118154 RepID=A0A9Q1FXJ4_SYNKA|nr:hypothetical protein SKAU_G00096510 [Synaphobranchus kaupii]
MSELKIQRKQLREESNPEPFEVAELEKVLQGLKCGKAAGYDNISPEFMKHLGPRALTWLTHFYTRIIHTNSIPKKWRTAKVIAVPKPGSVLAPTLFNLYTNDLPHTKSRKFIYADDICLATQAPDFESLEQVLTEDIEKVVQYCKTWRLKPSQAKTVSSVFHLQNAKAAKEQNILLSGLKLKHAPNPTYLGVTLDRTLSFKEHLKGTAAKVKSRNNLLYIFKPPTARLPSRRPIWKEPPPDDFTTKSAWEREWEAKDVPNKHLVSDPTQQVPGTNLTRRQWSTLNRFRTGHGPCLASLHRWGSSPSPLCACGEEQTMEHIIEACPLQRLKGRLDILHTADQESTAWLEDFAFAK